MDCKEENKNKKLYLNLKIFKNLLNNKYIILKYFYKIYELRLIW